MKNKKEWLGFRALDLQREAQSVKDIPQGDGGITKENMAALKKLMKKYSAEPVILYRMRRHGKRTWIERITRDCLIILLILAAGHAAAGEPQRPLNGSTVTHSLGHETPGGELWQGSIKGNAAERGPDSTSGNARSTRAPATKLLDAIAQIESKGRHAAVGSRGERGAYQIDESAWIDVSNDRRANGLKVYPWTSAHQPYIARVYASGELI